MISVASLLNPVSPTKACVAVTSTKRSFSHSTFGARKRTKMSRPTSVLLKASPVGKVRYPPCEIIENETSIEHHKFQVQSPSTIKQCPRHIPYNSDKKTFQERTGRDAFEAFHYSFRMPGDPVERDPHVVMWDYNVGLVRITALFKSLKYPKTMPAKVMSSNPGLKEISHSITGGSISAQGYWIPYEAARAVAAKFCWDIRHVLTPVFGADFPDICLRPDDPCFLKLNIDRSIVLYCTELAHRFRGDEVQSYIKSMHRDSNGGPAKSLRPKSVTKNDYESGYGTDTDHSQPDSPQSEHPGWTAINSLQTAHPHLKRSRMSTEHPKMIASSISDSNGDRPCNKSRKHPRSINSDSPAETDALIQEGIDENSAKWFKSATKGAEARAAYTLVALHQADVTFAERAKSLGRRASWPK